jgi:hypothetical protein
MMSFSVPTFRFPPGQIGLSFFAYPLRSGMYGRSPEYAIRITVDSLTWSRSLMFFAFSNRFIVMLHECLRRLSSFCSVTSRIDPVMKRNRGRVESQRYRSDVAVSVLFDDQFRTVPRSFVIVL